MSTVATPAISRFARPDDAPVGWAVSPGLIAYDAALTAMEAHAAAIARGEADEMVWLLEHPPIYTAGVSAKLDDLISPDRFPVFKAGRGGQFTYHGPGQRVAYVMLDLRAREAFDAGHIGDARNVPAADLPSQADSLKKWRDKTVITYDDTGSGGANAARTLTKLGFTKVFNLEGGLNAWVKDNLPLTKGTSGGKAGGR